MNYFTINGKRYRAEIRKDPNGESFIVDIEQFFASRWGEFFCDYKLTRAAARRALKRELIRLAIGPDGKRENFEVVYPSRQMAAFERALPRIAADAGALVLGMTAARDATERLGESARKIIARAAESKGLPVGEFVRRVRGEL
jgi:hypothetical protein